MSKLIPNFPYRIGFRSQSHKNFGINSLKLSCKLDRFINMKDICAGVVKRSNLRKDLINLPQKSFMTPGAKAIRNYTVYILSFCKLDYFGAHMICLLN